MDIRLTPKRFIFLGCALGLFLALALATGGAEAQDTGQELPYDEKAAQSIDRMLLCPVCPAESIDQAQVPIARQMRALVREMLAQGVEREQILKFFEDRYGTDVLAAPPKSGVNLLAWFIPVAAVLAALAGGLIVIRAMTARRAAEVATEPPIDEGLDPYLEAVDRELDLFADAASATPPSDPQARERVGGASDPDETAVEPHREEGSS